MIICPNFNNPDITREFNELKDAVGEKAAYAIWSLNNGNAIDKAPNGAESKLFLDLLQHFNGDRIKAIRAKAKTYGASFMRWFGDWINAAKANMISLGKEIPNTDKYSKYGQKGETDIEIREVLDENGNVIGTVRMEFSGKNRNGVVTLHPQLSVTGKGYGTALYQHIADTYGIPVEESFGEIGKSEAGKALWNKLQRDNNTQISKGDIPLRQLLPANASKVVDHNGEPLVVYRGDSNGKTQFNSTKPSYNVQGIYIAGNKTFASNFTKPSFYNNFTEGTLYAVFVNAKNPIYNSRDIEGWNNGKYNTNDSWIYGNFPDGNGELVVRNSNQIKSVENSGMFSAENDNIQMFIGKLDRAPRQEMVSQLVQLLQEILAPLGNKVHGLADMQKYFQEHHGILNGKTQLSIDWITIPPIPAGSSLYKELSEADKAQQKTVEELNRINKLLHGQEIYESSMQTADGEIKIDQSTSDKEEDKIWISCGKSIYGKVTISIVANTNKNLIGGSIILPAKQLTKEDTNYERLDNPIRINHAGILKAVLSHFINAGHKRPASKWLWYAGDYGYKRNVEALSKMLGIDVSPYFQYELSQPIDTVDRNGKPTKSYKERVVVDAEGLLRALPTLLDTKQYNEILKAIEFNEQDNTSYELQRKALADQYKILSEKNEKLLDEIQRIKKEIQRESYKMYDLPFFLTPDGELYGFVAPNGDIYLDETKISSEHPIHEYTHLWDRIVAKKNPKLWERGIQLMRLTSLWKQIENDPNYGKRWKAIQNITDYKLESLIASEVHARLVGKGGQRLLDNLAKEKGAERIIDKLKLWILDFWKDLKSTFSNFSDEEMQKLTLKDFNYMTLRDFVDAESFTDGDNIMLNMSYKNIFYHLKDLATDYVINNRLMTLKAFNSMYGTNLQYTDSKRHGVWAKNPKLWGIDVSDNSYDPTAVKPRYLIDQISLRSYLQEKFGIKIKVVSDEYYNRVISDSSYSWCGIRGDTMYIRESRNGMISNELYIEEFLHPMIHLLYSANKQLSYKLIALAKRDFPLLCEQIQKMYEDRGQDVINEEIITLVLSKYLNKELSISGTNSRDLINYISKIVEKIFLAFKDLFGNIDVKSVREHGKILISGRDITDVLNYYQLAELINSKLAIFRDVLGEDEKMLNMLNDSLSNNQQLPSITRQLYSLGEQIDLKRQQYITAVVDLYKKNNPDAQQNLIAKVYNEARKQFNLQQSDAILRENLLKLATLFGLHMNVDGYFESSETGQKKLMLEHFINSLQQNTSKTYRLSNISKPKYQQVGHVLNATSFANVIYSALYDGELATLDKQMARDYVRMFWGSDLILSALDSLHTNNQTSQLLEDRLVERMTKEPVQSRPQTVEWFNNIWNRLKDIVKTVFGIHSFTEEQKNDIVNAATAAYMVSQDLEYTENNNVIYDRIDGDYSSSDLLSEQDKKILSNIKQGILTRIKSQHARSISKLNLRLIADLKSSLELIDSKNEDSVEDVFDIIERFLKTANLEIMQTRHYIDNNLILKPKSEWDAQVVNQILQDLIGYYLNLLMQVYSLFSDRTSAINKYNQYRVENNEDAVDLKNFVSQLVKDISGLQQDYNSHVVMPYVKMVLTDYVNLEDAISDKQTFLYNMYKFLEQDSAYGDLAAGEVLVGMASRSKSSVVRIVEKMMRQAESAASRLVLKKGHDLMRLYDKVRPIGSQISPVNWQKRFMEFDRDGIPTRYFIREINYGQFYKDKDEKERQLRIKYGLIVDENGDTVFPENEETTKDDSVYNKYYDELDEWLDKHCERRYKLQYYKDRRRYLSPKTIRALQLVLRQINLLLDKCRVNDEFVDLSKLTQNERVLLRDLRKRKRDLGSYYTFTDIGGILHVEEKTGDALQIAKEITAWNKYVNGKVNYNPDWNAFNAAKRTIEELFGKDSEEVRNFVRSNTIKRITPEFYNLLKLAIGVGATSKHLEELKARHRLIINALKLNVGYSSQNLSKLGLGLNTDRSGWIELQKIEQEMANERRRLKAAGVKGEKPTDAESLTFEQIARMMPVTVGDRSTKTYLSYLLEQWRAAAASNTDLLNIFNSMFTYTDEKGRTTFLKAFLYLSPKDAEVTVNGRKYNCIETIPGSEYSELDEHSSFVNERFDKNGPSLLAKAVDENGNRLYKSEEYEKLTDNEKLFLNALLQTMDESWEMIPKTANREHKLPQVSGRTMTTLSNTLRCQEWQTAIGYTLRKFGTTYAETTDDVSTNADLARRPDGSVVNNIPIRFINDLDNPIVLSTDVLGSVMMFYDMACNYHYKSQNLPTLELIKYAVRPQLSGTNQMKDQYSKIENLLDLRYYGKETSFGFDSNEKITPAKLRTIQTTKTIRNLAAVAMLGVNFTTIEVGYADAMISVLCESIAGKYITVEDATWAFGQCIVHTKNALKGLGKPVVDDKLVAAMQYNQLSRSNSEIFSMTDMNKASRFVHQHLLMGGYTLSDYMVNGLVLLATYHHYRLIEDPTKGKKRFFSKSDAINTFTKLGYSEKEAVRLWKKADVTLWDAYDSKKGDLVVKDEYKDIVTKALEDRIMGRVTDRTAMYNGVIPQAEKAKLLQNVFGSFITLMRNFYINTYWDRFKTGGDYVAKDGDHTITWRSEYARDDLGMVNLETGEFEGAVFKDFVRGLYKMTKNVANFIRGGGITKLTGEQKYALVRLTSELVIVGLLGFWMVSSWIFARENDYDDDKENAWTLELFGENKGLHFKTLNMDKKFFNWMRWKMALLSTRTFTERLTPWTPQVAIELFTSPSTATSYLDDIGLFWGLFIDLINGDVDKEIKNGGYKHTSRGTRDILKLFSFTGIDNIVRSWHEDGIKSTANYYRKLSPTTLFIPSLELWNEEHGLGSHGASGGSSGSGFLEFE